VSFYLDSPLSRAYPPLPPVAGGARLSADRTYRHALWRWVDTEAQILPPGLTQDEQQRGVKEARAVLFVLLNPSTADELKPDLTVQKCKGFARSWGYDVVLIGNLYDFRTKSPEVLLGQPYDRFRHSDRCLPELVQMADHASRIVVGWGHDGAQYPDRVKRVRELLVGYLKPGETLMCLGETKNPRCPKHPSRLGYAQPLIPWNHY
jgi:hypothetical protein